MIIRGGTVVDGTGSDGFIADVAIVGERITEVGRVAGTGIEDIDTRGRLVISAFVDLHTHYDGQVTWANQITLSSDNGVTTVLMGNCGVGFAPVRPHQHDMLTALMEGVEDIPERIGRIKAFFLNSFEYRQAINASWMHVATRCLANVHPFSCKD